MPWGLHSCRCEYGAHVLSRLGSKGRNRTPSGPAADLVSSLRQIIESYLPGGYPALELTAEIGGMSPRTLQRRLAEVGLSYRALVDQARFEVAVPLLTGTNATSTEIAREAGYRDPSHFARAFRRLTGCSPREYRRQRVSGEPQLGSVNH